MDRDYDLIRRWFDGKDEAAAAEFVVGIEPFLRSVAFKFTQDFDLITEVVDTVLARLTTRDQYRPGGFATYRTYAATCVRNGVFTYFRRTKNQPVLIPIDPVPDEDGVAPCDPADPDADPTAGLQTLDDEAAHQLYLWALEQLPEKYRIPTRLADTWGWTYRQISQVLAGC